MSRIRPPLTTSMTVPLDDAVLLLDLLDGAPGALVLGALLGQDQPAFLVLLLEDQGLDLVADLDDLVGVDVVLDRQLARGDDALGLVADVEQDLVAVDLDDGAFDDVAVVEVLDGRVDRGEEVLFGADVVDRDLGRVVVGEVGVLLVIREWVPWGWTDVRAGARESRFHLQRKDSVGRSGTGTSEREAAPSETRADLRCSGKDIRTSHDESNRCRRTLCACDVGGVSAGPFTTGPW